MDQTCCEHSCEVHGDRASFQLARDRNKVSGAILLAAAGRYRIVVANMPDARLLAGLLHDEAARSGVEIVVDEVAGGGADLLVRHA